jgi:hypothetical protein
MQFMEDKMKRVSFYTVVLLAIMAANSVFAATKVLEWKFEGNLNDTSGNALDGIAFGTAAYDTGVSGQAFSSDSTNCVYKTGINTAILPVLASDTWTVNVWVWPNGAPWYYDGEGVQRSWRIAWWIGDKGSNSRTFYCSDSGGIAFTDSKGRYLGTGISWDVNQWQMVTTTYDGSNIRIYKNGLLIGKKTWTFTDAHGDVNMPSYAWSGTNNFFKGKFDEFAVWRGALTQQEIIALIPPGILPEGAYLEDIAHYTLDDPNEDTITMPDHSGYSNTGSLYGYTSPVGDWVVPGVKGGALLFNGGQAIDLPQAPTVDVNISVSQYAQHSVAFWFKSGYQPFDGAFYCEKSPVSGNGSSLIIRGDAGTDGTIKAYSRDQYYQMQYSITYDASAYMDSTTWHHLAVVCDGDFAKLYIDGNDVNTVPVTGLGGKTSMRSSIGFSWDALGFLGAWDKTYLDDFHVYKGALTQQDVRALAARGNINNDFAVDFHDISVLENEWRQNTTSVPGTTLLVDNMEGSLANWSISDLSPDYNGTGTISSTTNAYAGTKAMQWNYNLPAKTGGNYASIRCDLGTGKDLTGDDAMKLYLYRHAGNTPEASNGVMYIRFYDASNAYQAESFIYGPNSVVLPVNQWSQWLINLNAKLHQAGETYVTKSVLNNIRYIVIGCGSSRADARTGAIDLDEVMFIKYPICSPYLAGDIGSLEFKDCIVDLEDLAAITEDWLIEAY